MKKYVPYILLLGLLMAMLLISFMAKKQKVITKNLFYMDTYINVKVYSDKKEVDSTLKEVDKIYKEYHQLTDRYNSYEDLVNVYYINNNNSEEEALTIDKRLYDILEYGLLWKNKSNGLFNIEIGSVIDVWKKYLASKDGIPTKEELEIATKNIKEVKLLGDNKILNNNPNIDLGAIAKGYVTDVAGEYLKKQGFDKFIINAGGQVLVGNKYHKDLYKIGVKSPLNNGENLAIINGENICVATSGSYERFYEYNGVSYNHIINPNTLYPGTYMKSVTVLSSDSKLNDVLTTTLFLMPIDEGKKFISQMDGVEAIWFTNDNKIIKSEGFSKYEQK